MLNTLYSGNRLRVDFAKTPQQIEVPNLLQLQQNSYDNFLMLDGADRSKSGIENVFQSVFPIHDSQNRLTVEYIGSEVGKPKYTVRECMERGLTYAVSLRMKTRLVIWERNENTKEKLGVKDIKEQSIFVRDIPLMTERTSFIINGVERVVVNQLHRSPGVIFKEEESTTSGNKLIYTGQIIPDRGSWLYFEYDPKDILYMRTNKRRKVPVTIMFRALGYSKQDILKLFYPLQTIAVKDNSFMIDFKPDDFKGRLDFDLVDDKGNLLITAGKRLSVKKAQKFIEDGVTKVMYPLETLVDRHLAEAIINPETGEVLFDTMTSIDETKLKKMAEAGVTSFVIANDLAEGVDGSIINAFIADADSLKLLKQTEDIEDENDLSAIRIYKVMRPGEPVTKDAAKAFVNQLFFDPERYDLTRVGRMKMNHKLGMDIPEYVTVLTNEDIINTVKYVIKVKNGQGHIDDRDHLGNRRIRSIGELLGNELHNGLIKMQKAIKDKLSTMSGPMSELMPHDLINSKMITSTIMEFFSGGQLSQFMDQTNPLSELTHKRRLSALGEGGLVKERAGFEVRDVHPTHYGRICPIETPEGQNIGLINTLATYSKVNEHGFIEAPYKVLKDGVVTNEVIYLTATQEEGKMIAAASNKLDSKGQFIEDLIAVRQDGEIIYRSAKECEYADLSSHMVVGVAASLIPFLEHDDANRALMGANMQRQAVPCLRPDKPLVGTGLERIVAVDSGTVVLASRGGIVDYVDANRVVIRVNDDETAAGEVGVDIYNLIKYTRSNQNTNINQRPIVQVGDRVARGDVVGDGASTDLGELALGQNMTVAFMPWNGYNFEDSILISEKIVADDRYTSIHIEELSVVARDTKLGSEEITRDISNLAESQLSRLDESGIVYIGAEVEAGDVLVGKVTPKGETTLTPEEKLLRAIFGEKASDVKDTSLRVPSGMIGTVIDVQVFTREGIERDARAQAIIQEELQRYRLDLNDQLRIVEGDAFMRLEKMLIGKVVNGGPKKLAKGAKIDKDYLADLEKYHWFDIRPADDDVASQVEAIKSSIEAKRKQFDEAFEEKRTKLTQGDDLQPGVTKMVKVYLAVKRRLQPGDKMAGRHGNNGVVSKIAPAEDMPFMADGRPVDIVLNPLGVPSRMNVGQILETHLGWAAQGIGKRIDEMVRQQAKQAELRKFLKQLYNETGRIEDIDNFTDEQITVLAENLRQGLPFATPVFDGATEAEISRMLELAYPEEVATSLKMTPSRQQMILCDGRTGDQFERPVTVGVMHVLKLHHLVDDKMHARSTGPYSLVTQQPLGGKAQFGGQRFGEMEVWALEAYGASYVLQEMLTVKSDDVAGRTKVYENIVKGEHTIDAGMPESFNVLVKEIRSLGIDIDMERN